VPARTTYLAFLRAVNVGSRTIAMDRLRAAGEAMGFGDVRTVLTSGNLVLTDEEPDPDRVARRLEAGCRDRLGLATEVMVRDVTTLESVIDRNPFPEFAQQDPSHLLVVLLKEPPRPDAAAAFADGLPGPEEGRVVGAHAFVTYPAGIGRSRLTLPRIEAALGTRGTGRNWNTVRRVAALGRAPVGPPRRGG
jgi:uncharacterized protein (DUF1697 family)